MPIRTITRYATTTVTCLLLSVSARAQVDGARVDDIVHAQMKDQMLIGVAIGIIDDGSVELVACYGHENREEDIPVSRKTMFRWASISKPLTAIAAVQLAARDELDLDADVRELVPEFPDKETTITTRQLLGHLGGIVHYSNGPVIRTRTDYAQDNPYQDVIVALDTFKESPLVALPGEEYSYTTHGYILASAVVQRAGERPFHAQVDERIADPLDLESLQPDYQWHDIPHRAMGYRKNWGVAVQSTDTDVSWKLGGGGFISTIDDLAAFAAALCDPSFITPEMRRELWTPQKTADGKATGYGLGFGISRHDGTLVVRHSGAQEKVRGYMAVEPDTRRGVVVLTNSEYGKPASIANAILELLREKPEP